MPLTRADRVALHKKQERISLKSGEVPDVSDLKEGIPVLRSNHQGVVEYIRHNNVLYTRAYTAVGEGGVESTMTAVTNSMAFTPGTNQVLSRMSAGSISRPNLEVDVVGDLKMQPQGAISLQPGRILSGSGSAVIPHVLVKSGSSTTLDIDANGKEGAGSSIKLLSILDSGDYCMIDTTTHGETEIQTVDDDAAAAHLTLTIDGDTKFVPTGSVIIDKDWSDTTATTLYGLQIDFDKTGTSTSNNTMYGLHLDMDNTTPTNGTNNMIGFQVTPTLQHAADAGITNMWGGIINVTGSSGGTSSAIGLSITTSGSDTLNGLLIDQVSGTHLKLQKDSNDYATFTVADTGDLTIATIGDGTVDSDLTLAPDGDCILDIPDTGKALIDIDHSNTTAGSYYGLSVDFDKTGTSSSGTNNMYGLNITADNTTATDGTNVMYGVRAIATLTHAADAGNSLAYGAFFKATAGTNGAGIAIGFQVEASGGDTNRGLVIKCEDNGQDIRILSTANTSDYAYIQTTTNGATNIRTTDADAALAHLTLDADGDVISDPVSGITKFYLSGDTNDYASLTVAANGVTTLATFDDGGTVGHLVLDPDGELNITPDGDVTLDRDVSLTTAGTYTGLSIDLDKTGSSTSDNTIYGLNIDVDNATATNGTNTMYGIHSTPSLSHAADAGTVTVIGGYFKAVSGSNGTNNNVGIQIDQAPFAADSSLGLQIRSNADTGDYFAISTGAAGVTTISTVDDNAAVAHLTLDVDGKITLDSASGEFEMLGTGSTAKFADMYAGMILGYTVIGLDATPAKFDVTAAMLPVHDDLKVSFVFPPSGKVEIMASIYIQTDSPRALTFGLSTTDASTGFASLGAEYENGTYYPTGADGEQHEHTWYVTGTAGDAEELWFSAGANYTGRFDLYWGGDSSSVADGSHPVEYQPFVMKATALPATINTG